MRIFISGCAGFIGSHLAYRLLGDFHEVTGIDNLSNSDGSNIALLKDNSNFTFLKMDINEVKTLKGFDVVHHFACAKNRLSDLNPFECIRTNIQGTYNLMRIANRDGVKKFVHSSTGSVYGISKRLTFDEWFTDEETPPAPISIYGVNKLCGESYLQFFDFESVCLRYFHVYGQRGSGVINKFIRLHRKGKPLEVNGDGEQIRSFTHVSDIVEANVIAGPGVHNVCSGIQVTVNEVIRMIEEVSGRKAEIIHSDALSNDVRYFNVKSNLNLSYKKDLYTEIKRLYEGND